MEKNIPLKLISGYLRNSFIYLLCFASLKGNAQKSAVQCYEAGLAFFEQKKYNKAIEAFEKAVEHEGSIAEYHYQLGISNIAALDDASFFEKANLS